MSVNDPGDQVVVDNRILSCQLFSQHNTFIHRLVGEHRAVDQVADGIDVRHVGLVVVVDFDPPVFVQFDLRFIKSQSFSTGFTASGNQHLVAGQRLCSLSLQVSG